MTRRHLIFRSLVHFWRPNLAVVGGMAVATAVLTGALMVGDSVRGSLRELALERMGKVDLALSGSRFFPQELAERLSQSPEISSRYEIAPAVIVNGGAANDAIDESHRHRTAGVQIAGVGAGWEPVPVGNAVVNGELADALNLEQGPILLTLPREDPLSKEATLAHRGRSQTLSAMRLAVQRVVRARSFLSLFRLQASQRTPRNVWVNLAELQEAAGQMDQVNTMLVHQKTQTDNVVAADQLNARLREIVTLEDFGVSLSATGDKTESALTSRAIYVPAPVLNAAHSAAEALKLPIRQVTVNLLNRLEKVNGGADMGTAVGAASAAASPDAVSPPASLHYLIVAGIADLPDGALAADELALNEWTATRLGAKIGDELRFTYYGRQDNGDLREVSSAEAGLTFRLARILPMRGLGADPSLTPAYKGLTDAQSISDWDPPEGVKIDQSLVTPADEAYWDQYRAAPKVFINLATAQKLWAGAYGAITSVRVPAARADAFAEELRKHIDPVSMGMVFTPVKSQQLAAAGGSTDFAGLFVGFSFFLIVAAALLVAMLFRLNLEQRARQLGLLDAVGFSPRIVRGMAMGEGATLGIVGGVVGLAGGVGYTALMIAGLRTWWVKAVGTNAMHLYIEPMTLAMGFALSLLIALLAVAWGTWRVAKVPAGRLLAGAWTAGFADARSAERRPGRVWIAACLGALIGIGLLVAGMSGKLSQQESFLGGGAILLASSLLTVTAWLRRPISAIQSLSLASLGVRNARRHTARSALTMGLIAFAAFILMTIAAMKEGPPTDTHDKKSGAGGFGLILQADIPLLGDLGTKAGRQILGVRAAADPLFGRARFISMRTRAGQDVSCLNLMQPTDPTILAVPHDFAAEGRFEFSEMLRKIDNPWMLLEEPDPDGAIPIIADQETAAYILKWTLGTVRNITDQSGAQRDLRLVATLRHSVFQSELLVGESDFRRLFPAQSGFGTVLIQASAQDERELRRRLATELDEYAVTVDTTADRLARYQEVANTYLSTFQTLGALGLMLGTIGLAVALLRNLAERRGELALLAALGFAPSARIRLVLAENVFLLIAGLAAGTLCAIVGVLPVIIQGQRGFNLVSVAAMLLGVLATGLAVLMVAVFLGQRHLSPADLRSE